MILDDNLKLRLWDREKKLYHYLDEFHFLDNGMTFELTRTEPDDFECHIDDNKPIIERCTGLKDKNKRLIYQSDIILHNGFPFIDMEDKKTVNYIGVVEWVFAGWQYVYKCVNPKLQGISDGMNTILEDGSKFEVIGDIHRNLKDGIWIR